jgi:hypothetical protein
MYNGAYLFEDTILNLFNVKSKQESKIPVHQFKDFKAKEKKDYVVQYKGLESKFSIIPADNIASCRYKITLSNLDETVFAPGSKLMVYRNDGSELLDIEQVFNQVNKAMPTSPIYLPFLSSFRNKFRGEGVELSYFVIKGMVKETIEPGKPLFKIVFPHDAKSVLFSIDGGFVVRGEKSTKPELARVSSLPK